MITPQNLFSQFSTGYLLLVVLILIAAVWSQKTPGQKVIVALGVIILFVVVPVLPYPERPARLIKLKPVDTEKLNQAMSLYNKHCESAGEKIYKTVDNVNGVFLMKVRPKGTNYGNQFKMDDPYGRDEGGDRYLMEFLYGRNDIGGSDTKSTQGGFRYIDAVDSKDGQRYRYTGFVDEPLKHNPNASEGHAVFSLKKIPVPAKPLPSYGVTYDDISTQEDREHWIAGSSLRVIDLQTNEVIAERIGYMIDYYQGQPGEERAPWISAAKNNACPPFPSIPGQPRIQIGQTRRFVEKVLHPAP